jgi:hypothetical protein
MKNWILWLIVALVIAAGATIVGVMYYKEKKKNKTNSTGGTGTTAARTNGTGTGLPGGTPTSSNGATVNTPQSNVSGGGAPVPSDAFVVVDPTLTSSPANTDRSRSVPNTFGQ